MSEKAEKRDKENEDLRNINSSLNTFGFDRPTCPQMKFITVTTCTLCACNHTQVHERERR